MSEGAAPITNMAILNPGAMGAGAGHPEGLIGNVAFKSFPSAFVGFSTAGGLIDIAFGNFEKITPGFFDKIFGKSNFLPEQAVAGFNSGLFNGGQGADAGAGSSHAGADAGAGHHHPANDHAPMHQGFDGHHHPSHHDHAQMQQQGFDHGHHNQGHHDHAPMQQMQQHGFDQQGHNHGPVHQDHGPGPSGGNYSNHDPILAARLGIPMEELNYQLSLNPDKGRGLQVDPNNYVPINSGHGPDYTPPVHHHRSRELVGHD